MINDSVPHIHDAVTDIPLTCVNNVQEDAIDPRLSQLYCQKVHERKKQFLSKYGQIPHKLFATEKSSNTSEHKKAAYHCNAHNFEMINNPRDTPFFSLHGHKYEEDVKYFDPRRTKTTDILGQTIYQKQAFLDVQEEIPASNDVIFDSFFTDFDVDQSLDLQPLKLGEVFKEDGELAQTFTLSPVSSENSILEKEDISSGRESLDDYRDLLIDVLMTRNPLKMRNTLKSSNLIQRALNVPNSKDSSPRAPASREHLDLVDSYVEEKSVVGYESLPNTPKVTSTAKKSSLLRLASDPNHSFVDEFDRSLQPTSSSTPISKLRSNISSKRKKIDKPKLKSPKSNAVATQQLNKRPKTTNVNSDFHADVENPISGTPSLPHHKQTSSLEYKNIEEPVDMPNPTTESQNVSQRLQNQSSSIEPTVVINDEEMKSNYNALKPKSNQLNLDVVKKVEVEQKNSSEIDKSPQQTELKELENDQTAQLEGKLQDANEDRSQEKQTVGRSVSTALAGEKTPTIKKAATPSKEYASSKEDSLEKPEKIAQRKLPSLGSSLLKPKEASPKTTTPSKKPYARDVCNSEVVCLKDDRRKSASVLDTSPQSGRSKRSNRKSSTLLDAGLKSIRQIKGKDDQEFNILLALPTDNSTAELNSKHTENSTLSTASEVEEKLKPLAFKDRAIAEQLLKYCDCWTEETKHSTCVDLYGDFLVTINNRYCQQLDMSIVNSALSILTSHSDKIDPDNFLLKTALFTTKLLKVLTSSSMNNQTF